MDYPDKLKIGVLQSERGEYTEMSPHIERIALLVKGGYKLRDKLSLFLKQRRDEEDDIYKARIEKFTYSNVLGAAVSQLAAKFSNGQVHISGPIDEDLWAEFRENNDGKGRTERQLLNELFSHCLPYRQVWAHVDKPRAPYTPRSAADEEALGLKPRVILYSSAQVLSWDEKDDGAIAWVKVFQVVEEVTPTAAPRMKALWTFIDDECICTYAAYVKVVNGKIRSILNDRGDYVSLFNDAYEVSQVDMVRHGFGCVPVVRVVLPYEMWGGNQAYPKAEESLRLEAHRYDLLTNAYWQRYYKRAMIPDSLDVTFEQASELPTGLQHVVEADNFSWSEPTGAIIEPLTITLEKAKKEIRALLAIGGAAYSEGESVSEASGESKKMDFVNEDERLQSYGHIFTDALQDIYQLVAKATGNRQYSEIAVSGLDEFGHDKASDFIESLTAFVEIDIERLALLLPPTLFVLVREKLLAFLLGNLTPEQKSIVADELATMPIEVAATLASAEATPES